MKIKGVEKFREKIPMLSGNKIFLLPLYWFSVLLCNIALLRWFDSLPGKLGSAGISWAVLSFLPLAGELLVAMVGLILVYQMWFWRKHLKAIYGPRSYQRIFLIGFGGAICLVSLIFNQFLGALAFPAPVGLCSPLKFLIVTPEVSGGSYGLLIFWTRTLLAVLFSGLGLMTWLRAVKTFGVDYVTVVYLYFPEESQFQDHKIYSVLRHPIYAAGILLGLGGTLASATLYSVICFGILLSAFAIHVHFVEEKELVERFGPSYQEYIKKVPAFFVKPGKAGIYLRFLLGKA